LYFGVDFRIIRHVGTRTGEVGLAGFDQVLDAAGAAVIPLLAALAVDAKQR